MIHHSVFVPSNPVVPFTAAVAPRRCKTQVQRGATPVLRTPRTPPISHKVLLLNKINKKYTTKQNNLNRSGCNDSKSQPRDSGLSGGLQRSAPPQTSIHQEAITSPPLLLAGMPRLSQDTHRREIGLYLVCALRTRNAARLRRRKGVWKKSQDPSRGAQYLGVLGMRDCALFPR